MNSYNFILLNFYHRTSMLTKEALVELLKNMTSRMICASRMCPTHCVERKRNSRSSFKLEVTRCNLQRGASKDYPVDAVWQRAKTCLLIRMAKISGDSPFIDDQRRFWASSLICWTHCIHAFNISSLTTQRVTLTSGASLGVLFWSLTGAASYFTPIEEQFNTFHCNFTLPDLKLQFRLYLRF